MSQQSNIEWTDTTWNPSTGCSVVSSGCKFCYAEKLAERLHRMGSGRYENGFKFTLHWDKVDEPRRWRKPRKVFVNSMSDLFHEDSEFEFVRRVFKTMMATPRHQYQVLTKRPERAAEWLQRLMAEGEYRPSPHIWMGTSVEDEHVLGRVDALREIPAGIRFLSCEPLIGPLPGLDVSGIHWVIVGGESGIHLWNERLRARRGLVNYAEGTWTARSERVPWVREIRDICLEADVAFFFKQWGGATPKAGGRELDGRSWDQYPDFSADFSGSPEDTPVPVPAT